MLNKFLAVVTLSVSSLCAFSQTQQDIYDEGVNSTQSYAKTFEDSVNLWTFQVNLNIPLLTYKQKGSLPPITLSLVENQPHWYPSCVTEYGNVQCYENYSTLDGVLPVLSSFASVGQYQMDPDAENSFFWGVHDAVGGTHNLYWVNQDELRTLDGTGYKYVPSTDTLYDNNGIKSYPAAFSQYNTVVTDATGNTITTPGCPGYNFATCETNGVPLIDSLGRTIPGQPRLYQAGTLIPVPGCKHISYPVYGGGTADYQFCYSNIAISIPGQDYGNYIMEPYNGTVVLLTQAILPNQTSWSFAYDNYGKLIQVTTPTNGVITYTASSAPAAGWPGLIVPTFQRTENATPSDPSQAHTWNYTFNFGSTTLNGVPAPIFQSSRETKPDGTYSDHYFSIGDAGNSPGAATNVQMYEYKTVSYDSSGNVLQTIEKDYTHVGLEPLQAFDVPLLQVGAFPALVTTTTGGVVKSTCTVYDIPGLYSPCSSSISPIMNGLQTYSLQGGTYEPPRFPPASSRIPAPFGSKEQTVDYDYGSGSPGSVLHQELDTFLWQDTSKSAYIGANIIAAITKKQTYDGSMHLAAETDYGIDEAGAGASCLCGLATSESKLLFGASPIISRTAFNSNGMTRSITDPQLNVTTYTYDTSGAYVIRVDEPTTSGIQHFHTMQYDFNSGLLTAATDENGNTTSYSYDVMGRKTGVYPPSVSAQETYTYNDASTPFSIAHTKEINAGVTYTDTTFFDGLHRPIEIQLSSDPQGVLYKDISYDANGRTSCESNLHYGAGLSGVGEICTIYDGIDRVKSLIRQDGASIIRSYTGNIVTVTDENNNTWNRTYDGLERLSGVVDPIGATTTYQYDSVNNLTQVKQLGLSSDIPRIESFVYDSLSRLVSSTFPESGYTCYGNLQGNSCGQGYDANGNLLVKTDARGVVINYSYDALNRLVSKGYTSTPGNTIASSIAAATPPIFYTYDQNSGATVSNGIGRLITEVTGTPGSPITEHSIISYDAVGRVISEKRCVSTANCSSFWRNFNYSYDKSDNLISESNGLVGGDALTFSYTYDAANRLAKVTSSLDDADHPGTLFGPPTLGAQYSPAGLASALLGISSTSQQAKYQLARTYDSRMRPSSGQYLRVGTAGSASSVTVVVYGTDGTRRGLCIRGTCSTTVIPDAGVVSLSLSDPTSGATLFTGSVTYNGESYDVLAQEILAAMQTIDESGNNPLVTGTITQQYDNIDGSSDAIHLTSLGVGNATNYTISLSITNSNDYDFIMSGDSMTGGSDVTQAIGQSLYSYNLSYQPNSNVLSLSDSAVGDWSYYYDSLNRMSMAQAAPNVQTGYAPYGWAILNWTYDSFGNYIQEALSGNTSFSMPQPSPYVYPDATNHISGFSYDNAGNQTSDPLLGPSAYAYDAESRLASSNNGAVGYIYDAQGKRVAKYNASGITREYLLDVAGQQVAELDGTGNVLHSNVYAGGALLAFYDNVGIHFSFSDWLGTRRVQANGSGSVEETCLSLPYGDSMNCSGTSPDVAEQHFTGKERDLESGLDYFGKRYYGSGMGRWISPDPVNLTEDRIMNPSSTLNKYAYGADNPFKYVDPDGQDVTYFYDQSGFAGHAVLFAYNQANGDSAIESFGPASKSWPYRIAEPLMPVPGVGMFDMADVKSADDLRKTYSAMTIQTSPELTQEVINFIRANPDPKMWDVMGPNCSSQVWKILKKFKLDNLNRPHNEGISPKILWNDLSLRYNFSAFGINPKTGRDYGRPSFDMFNLMWQSLPQAMPHRSCSINVNSDGSTSGDC